MRRYAHWVDGFLSIWEGTMELQRIRLAEPMAMRAMRRAEYEFMGRYWRK